MSFLNGFTLLHVFFCSIVEIKIGVQKNSLNLVFYFVCIERNSKTDQMKLAKGVLANKEILEIDALHIWNTE